MFEGKPLTGEGFTQRASTLASTVPMNRVDFGSNRRGAKAAMRTMDWVLVGLLALVLAPGLAALAEVWSASPYYSHGYFIPLVALWAASSKRRVLPLLDSDWDIRGLWVLAGALSVYLIGWLVGSMTWVGVSVVASVAGGVLLLRGRFWLKTLMFPIGFLLFMVPWPEPWLAALTGQLQLWVSELGTSILHAMGDPVLRRGNVIELPGGDQLFVAEACSGITSLLTLVPLGVILAYFTDHRLLRRILLILTVLPVALLGNLARVLLTVQMAQTAGVEAATGSAIHEWVGIFTYLCACGALLGMGAFLRWVDRRSSGENAVS